VTPPQALGPQEFVDAAALDHDALLLVEVGLEPVECPGAERQAQGLRIGQCRSDDGGPLVGVIGVRAARAGTVLQGGQPAIVEPADPDRNGRSGDIQLARDVGGRSALGDRQDDLSAFDDSGRGGASMGEPFQLTPLVGRQFAKGNSCWHKVPPCGWYPDQLANHLPDEPLRHQT
jgi:hypothetical protein